MSTINGKACVANGRNLLLGTEFNDLPKYWTSRAGTVTGTFNGHNVIYYDATTITGDYAEVLQQPIYDPTLTNNRVLPSHWYTLSFYAKGVGQMNTYVYANFVDTSVGSYIDGAALGYVNYDGSHTWDLTDGWTRHTYTFKSKSSFPATGVQNVLFRAYNGNEVYITMPKLETGTLATPWSPVPVDKVFSDGRQVYGRNLWAVSQSDFGYFSLASQSLVTTGSGDFNKYRKDMIATNGAKYISVRHIGDVPSNLSPTASGRIIAFDKDQKFISAILQPTTDADYFAVGEIPENTVYVLLHIVWGDSGETMIQFGNQETDWSPAPEDVM